MTKQIIMCPPHQFAVRYSINPWMEGNLDSVDTFQAHQQWLGCRNALVQAGADVIVMPTPPENCPDAVFAANAGLVYKGMFTPSYFKHPERQVEEEYFINYFVNEKKFVRPIHYSQPNPSKPRTSFEGAGDALFSADRTKLFMGYGFRTDADFKWVLDHHYEATDAIVTPLRLVDPRWYHLDTCFCPLDTGEVLWYRGAFDEYSQSIIDAWYEDKMIEVSEDDALLFACNSVSIGNTIVMPLHSDELFMKLTDRGYRVITVPMSQFLRSGGACKCLTLELVE